MEPAIVEKPAFTVVGIKYRGKNEHNEIPALWDAFIPRIDEVAYKSTPAVSYGVMGAYNPETGEFDYLAGFGVDRVEALPVGMERWDVPAQTYATFPCTLASIRETYDYIYKTWLPQSGYQHTGGTDFELYDEHFAGGDSTLYIYVPIKK